MVAKKSQPGSTAHRYIPDRGDIVWLSFDPHVGQEQGGRRPAVVVSSGYYNERVGLVVVCPITSRKKDYPFEVPIKGKKVEGVILADHIKSVDWHGRKVRYIERIGRDDMTTLQDAIAEVMFGA